MKCRTYSTLTAGTMYIHVYDTLHYCKDLMQPYVKKNVWQGHYIPDFGDTK